MMSRSNDPLAGLACGVYPVDIHGPAGRLPLEDWGFDQILCAAHQHEFQSGRSLRLVRDDVVTLTESQSVRLATAADAAEAEGFTRVAAIIDGVAVDLDVHARTVGAMVSIEDGAGSAPVLRAPFEGLIVAPPGEQDGDAGLCGIQSLTFPPAVLAALGGEGQSGEERTPVA